MQTGGVFYCMHEVTLLLGEMPYAWGEPLHIRYIYIYTVYCIFGGRIKGFNSAITAIICQVVVIEHWE